MSGLKFPRLPRTNYAQVTTAIHTSSRRPLQILLVQRSSAGTRGGLIATAAPFKHGRRFQSTTGGNYGQDSQKQSENTRAAPSLGSIFSAAFRSTLHSIRNVSRPETLRDAFRKNPEEMVLALILYVTLQVLRLHLVRPSMQHWHPNLTIAKTNLLFIVLLQLLGPAFTLSTCISTTSITGSSHVIPNRLRKRCAVPSITATTIQIPSAH